MYYERALPAPLGGISEQIPQFRLPGQVGAQTNMFIDTVKGLRRRPGVERISGPALTYNASQTFWYRALKLNGDARFIHCAVLNDAEPIRVLTETGSEVVVFKDPGVSEYLAQTRQDDIMLQVSGGKVYITSRNVTPVLREPEIDLVGLTKEWAHNRGYLYIASGAYSQSYTLTIRKYAAGGNGQAVGTSYTVSYTTPNGTASGHVAEAAPSFIAEKLRAAMNIVLSTAGLNIVVNRRDNVLSITPGGVSSTVSWHYMSVESETSTLLVRTSGKGVIPAIEQLPGKLPDVFMEEYVIQVGAGRAAAYYEYKQSEEAWLESSLHESRVYVDDLGVVIAPDTSIPSALRVSKLQTLPRAAGNDENNPTLKLLDGITGITSFKGRLVLMSNDYVCMSSTEDTLQFYRSTVTTIVDSDPIEVAADTLGRGGWRTALEFGGDLILFAPNQQGWIPGQSLSPRNFALTKLSEYACEANIQPISTGRSIFFAATRADGSTAIYEGVTLPDGDQNRLQATDITAHVPNLIQGGVNHLVLDAFNGVLLVVPNWDVNHTGHISIAVHQYFWSSEDKVVSAWHNWTVGDSDYADTPAHRIQLMDAIDDANGYMLLAIAIFNEGETGWKPFYNRINLSMGLDHEPHLDFWRVEEITALPEPLNGLGSTLPLDTASLIGYKPAIGLAEANISEITNTYQGTSTEIGDSYIVGYRYGSEVTLSPPIVLDRVENPILDGSAVVVRFMVNVSDSGPIECNVKSRIYNSGYVPSSTLGHYQPGSIGIAALKDTARLVIPSRTVAEQTELTLRTDDVYDLNVTLVDYGFNLRLKHKRG